MNNTEAHPPMGESVPPRSETILTIIAILATILLELGAIVFQQYLQVMQFTVIALACGCVVYMLIWLPRRMSEHNAKYLAYLDRQVRENLRISNEVGDGISSIQNRMTDLCAELTDGTGKRMSWTQFWAVVKHLQNTIEADTTFRPDIILSVGRSGAVVGGLLAGNMGGLIHLGVDRVNKWSREEGRLGRSVEILPPLRTLADVLEGKNVLCVMSECDSGKTMETCMNDIRAIQGIRKVKTAVLFRNANTYFYPDYIAEEDTGRRPDFPFRTSDWPRTSKTPPAMK